MQQTQSKHCTLRALFRGGWNVVVAVVLFLSLLGQAIAEETAMWGWGDDGSLRQSAQLSTGTSHSCAIQSNGTVMCWGDNTYGQATPPSGMFLQVGAGLRHSCGIRSDGTLICWGDDSYQQVSAAPSGVYAQLSVGANHACAVQRTGVVGCWGDNSSNQAPQWVVGSFVQVSAGDLHTCGLAADRSLSCWGSNAEGQFPQLQGMRVVQVNAGTKHTCVLQENGTAVCWGLNNYGQSTPPNDVFVQLSAGGLHTCGVKGNGTVRCWGQNDFGQATPQIELFVQVSAGGSHTCGIQSTGTLKCWGGETPTVAMAPTGRFLRRQVSAGDRHTCEIESNGVVSCWGDNSMNQATPPSGTFVQVSAYDNHTCGVQSDGAVACWGDNSSGQAPAYVPGPFMQVSTGSFHTCALQAGGTVACWGDNSTGRAPQVQPGSFVQVSAGTLQTCGILSTGQAVCWGLNNMGQAPSSVTGSFLQISASFYNTCGVAGQGPNDDGIESVGTVRCWGSNGYGQAPTFVLYESSAAFVQVDSGFYFTCWIKSDSTIGCWGMSGIGQVLTPATGAFVQVSVGATHACGVRSDGTAACWGDNSYGQAPSDINDPPAAVDDHYSTLVGQTLLIDSLHGLLQNDNDHDGAPIIAVKVSDPTYGTLTLNDDGSFTYIPTVGFVGEDSFLYQASDGVNFSNVATVTLSVTADSGTVTIVLEAQPNTPTNFLFSGDLGAIVLDDAQPDDGDEYLKSMSFTVKAGMYSVTEAVYADWSLENISCNPAANTIVDLANNQLTITVGVGVDMTCTFSNQRAGVVLSRAYNDLNRDQAYSRVEPWLSGWAIQLYSSPTTLVAWQTTDRNGQVLFEHIRPGFYTLCEVLPPGWVATTPSALDPRYGQPCYVVLVRAGRMVARPFGNSSSVVPPSQIHPPPLAPLDRQAPSRWLRGR